MKGNAIWPEKRFPLILSKVLLFLVSAVALLFVGYGIMTHRNSISFISLGSRSEEAFLVYTSGCKIPKVDPFAASVRKLLKPGRALKCDVDYDIVYQSGNKIFINKTAVSESDEYQYIKYCKYEAIWRPRNKPTSHNYFRYVNESMPFSNSITLSRNDEFICVSCYNDVNETIYTNFFTIVQKKEDVERRCKDLYKQNSKNREEHLNVMMLGIESVSRINMQRFMKETRHYLLHHMNSIELLGYTKVADNTFPNIAPMTTGKYIEELPWNETIKEKSMDRYDWMWNRFSREGYRTFYAEDAPKIAIFDYEKAGFERPATDYYNRHLGVAMEHESEPWSFDNNCIHARPETSFVLNNLKQFMVRFKSDPYFAFTFISRLTHDNVERPAMADKLYRHFFEEINKENTLNKTVIFFFSDHGIRFGRVRETFIGKLEERLPFMFIIFPKWFNIKYPNIKRNLETNVNRLTTPFDIYSTLIDILHFKSKRERINTMNRSMSLLNEIPESRTCDDAKMLPHWCSCANHKIIEITEKNAINSAKQIVMDLNLQLNSTNVCEQLTLSKIKFASELILPDKVLMFKSSDYEVVNRTVTFGDRVKSYVDYQLTIETKPGTALFEGTVRYNEIDQTYKLMGEVSRINRYGSQSHCVNNSHLKKICYCKVQL